MWYTLRELPKSPYSGSFTLVSMRAILLTLTLTAIAFAGCTDGDADADTNLGGVLGAPILAVAGDALGMLEFSEPVDLDSTPAQDELCQVGRVGLGDVVWTIPEVDPETGGAWIAQDMTISAAAAGQSAQAGQGFVLEIELPDGSVLAPIQGDAETAASATINDAEAGAYKFIIHACESAAGVAETAESTAGRAEGAFQVDASANMVATETIYGEADGSASGSASASP
jgi:hypothetical protein